MIFYNDEKETVNTPRRSAKPRKVITESQEHFQARIDHWEASRHHAQEIKPKGNAMTQEYYVGHILPLYVQSIHQLRQSESDIPNNWLLQEDGDPSHGMRTHGLARKFKDCNWITNHYHPAQSPDLNPIEACWCILKQRVRQREWDNLNQLKEVIQEEWSRITMDEVRRRISEMPARCQSLVESGGKPIKSSLW